MKNQDSILQDEVHQMVKGFLATNTDVGRVPCSHLMWELLGSTAWKAPDEAYQMKAVMLDLLAFLTKPEIARGFAGKGNIYKDEIGNYLVRIITCLDLVDNSHAYAEILDAEMQISQLSTRDLNNAKAEYSKQLN
ncbi:MAG: hypothetical protein V4615_07005 [Bacteroidota bacterium]